MSDLPTSDSPATSPSRPSERDLREALIAALRTVFDPELPVNLYDLGLIYGLDITPASTAETAAAAPAADPEEDSVPATTGDAHDRGGTGGAFNVHIKMTLTTPNCPVAEQMPASVQRAVQAVEGVRSATVELVWEPAWSSDMMTEDAKLELEFRGISWKDPKAALGPMGSAPLTIGRRKVGERPGRHDRDRDR